MKKYLREGEGAARPKPDRDGTGRGMEPFVLLALAVGPAYGYQLAQELAVRGFRRAADDPSVVYKLLHSLHQRGLLRSAWEESPDGPPRRRYQLTAAGVGYLHERAADVRRQAQRLEEFLARYGECFPHGRPAAPQRPDAVHQPSAAADDDEESESG